MIAGGIVAAVLLAVGVKAYIERSQRAALDRGCRGRRPLHPGGGRRDPRRSAAGARRARRPLRRLARGRRCAVLPGRGACGRRRDARRRGRSTPRWRLPGAQQGDLALLARQALAYLDLAGGAVDAALTAFQELLKAQGGAVARAQIMLEIAAIHEKQGRAAEARRVYQDILAEHPDGSWVATAKDRLRLLAELSPSAS